MTNGPSLERNLFSWYLVQRIVGAGLGWAGQGWEASWARGQGKDGTTEEDGVWGMIEFWALTSRVTGHQRSGNESSWAFA